MADTPCVAFLRKLLAAIDERSLGEQAQSVGHKGRNTEFAQISLADMIAMYRMRYGACPDVAAADPPLPELNELNAPAARRGPPMRRMGRGYV